MTADDGLTTSLAEIEAHVHAAGWDQRPALFALVRAGRFAADDPATAARLGIDRLPDDALTPVEQEALGDEPLDEVLGAISWPDTVAGCALSQEIVVLPPSADAGLADGPHAAAAAAGHPDRHEARLTVGVLRGGASAALLRLRATDATARRGRRRGRPADRSRSRAEPRRRAAGDPRLTPSPTRWS